MRFIDLSHPITNGMVTYPGLPEPTISEHLSREASRTAYAEGTEFLIGRVTMVGNTGTYLDAPFHRYADGADVAGLPLDRLADLDAVVVVPPGGSVDASAFHDVDVSGRAVLVRTGRDRLWATDAYTMDAPHLTQDAATWLVEHGAALVGIDAANIDDTSEASGGERPVHTTLLGTGVPIVEHLTGLDRLPPEDFRFTAVPAPVVGMASFPVRAFAVVEP
ncbi:arylformamidase [Georgenia halophila]|uniref:Arylformamidase n=1 Tax=Georgenia halophila TaxID=620889 RepID=A0ABP8L8D4_9MICO